MPHAWPVQAMNALCTLCVLLCTPRAGPMHAPCTGHAGPVHAPCTPHARSVNTLFIPDAQPIHNPCTPCKPLRTPYALCMPRASKGWSSTFPKVVTYHLNDGHPHPKYGLPPRKDGNQACKGWSSTILRMIIHHPPDYHPPSQG